MNSCFINPLNFKQYFLILSVIFFLQIFAVRIYATGNDYSYSQGAAANFALLNQGADIAADKSVMDAVSSVSPNSTGSITLFGAGSTGESKYKTDSQDNRVDLAATSLIVGLAKSFNIYVVELTLGPFFEHGLSSYNGYSDSPKHSYGQSYYYGGGLLGHINFKNIFYWEFSGRLGFNQTNFEMYLNDVSIMYDYRSLYEGCHLGAGVVFKISSISKIDTYGKYFFTKIGSKDINLNNGNSFSFENINSRRLRVGTRLSFVFGVHTKAYCGAAWEYEKAGIVKINNSQDMSPKLEGGSGIGEAGVLDSFKDFYFDLSAQFYAGERKGASGMLRVSFDLFSRINRFLGYSIEKFNSDKIKRFSKSFSMSKKNCFDKTIEILKELKTRITHKNFKKGYIIAFDFGKSFENCCLDSTEAAVFITEINSDTVNVEVCSDNSVLGGTFATKFFEMLVEKSDDSNKGSDNKANA
ncbi:MAG: hypothetical protein LBS38_02095 [Endomicrobium sp.]|jgi:hypothetical protein|nr:hypothetical protein [Endomicrobium sp.]